MRDWHWDDWIICSGLVLTGGFILFLVGLFIFGSHQTCVGKIERKERHNVLVGKVLILENFFHVQRADGTTCIISDVNDSTFTYMNEGDKWGEP
jgi:hypothetical protein